ncbi:MAG: haloacid dehalogenase-like hydrolase [Pseudonocardia sp.]|nr:haloacid dehalogenase-like hydrolase [Pseudonocardia sp.]
MDTTTLPSWNDGPARRAVLEFLATVTEAGPGHVPPVDRVATFDNDGTLWCEQPLPPQFDFVLRRWAEMAEADPSKRREQPYQAAVERDADWLRHYYDHIPELLRGLAHAFDGATPEQFEAIVARFFTDVHHPRFGLPYDQVVYQPMRELLELLAANGFRVFIASGGGRDFMRVISEATYGVLRERVIGTAPDYEYRDGTLHRLPTLLGGVDDGPGKPVHIFHQVGRRPLLAGGNSDGDVEMMESARFALLVHHDDADREYAYDVKAERALDVAARDGWTVVSMRDDWSTVFPQRVPVRTAAEVG